MRKFFYSRSMLVILVLLLMVTFFLPDFIGPIPSLLIGAVVIGLSFFVYNKWCGVTSDNGSDDN